MRPAMDARITNGSEQIDHRTCVSICDAIGDRLKQSMRPEPEMSPHLRQLIEELRRRDNEMQARPAR